MVNGTLLITMCVITILAGIGVVAYAVWNECYLTRAKASMMLALGLLLVLVGIALGVCWKQYNAFYNAVDAGYTIYIDGQEVEAEHLNLDSYATYTGTHIDNDNQLILIDKR